MHAGSAVDELECIIGLGHHSHAGDACRLNIPARQIETVANDCAGQPVPGHRHHWEFRPGVGGRIVRFQRAKRRHQMAVLMFPTGHIDAPFVNSPRFPAPLGRHAGFHQTPLVGRRVVFFDNIGVAGGENEGAADLIEPSSAQLRCLPR